MSHWLSHSAAAVRDMRYRDAEADTVLQLDDIFLFVGQCGSCPRVAYSNDSFQDMRSKLMDQFVR